MSSGAVATDSWRVSEARDSYSIGAGESTLKWDKEGSSSDYESRLVPFECRRLDFIREIQLFMRSLFDVLHSAASRRNEIDYERVSYCLTPAR